jgi:hypothetical protein
MIMAINEEEEDYDSNYHLGDIQFKSQQKNRLS